MELATAPLSRAKLLDRPSPAVAVSRFGFWNTIPTCQQLACTWPRHSTSPMLSRSPSTRMIRRVATRAELASRQSPHVAESAAATCLLR